MHYRPVYRTFETTVAQVMDVTPRMRRITLHGESLSEFESDLPGQWVKLFFEENSECGRAFTIRHWRPQAREIDIDIVRHEHGIAGKWISNARPGLAVRLAGPRSDFQYKAGRRLFLIGDETALPAISAIVEKLPAGADATAIIEISDPDARQVICSNANISWSWIEGDRICPGRNLSTHARSLKLNPETSQIWIACESSAAREMRCAFRSSGFAKDILHASGYWKVGVVEHVDCDSDY